jgi:hypothetical protein
MMMMMMMMMMMIRRRRRRRRRRKLKEWGLVDVVGVFRQSPKVAARSPYQLLGRCDRALVHRGCSGLHPCRVQSAAITTVN